MSNNPIDAGTAFPLEFFSLDGRLLTFADVRAMLAVLRQVRGVVASRVDSGPPDCTCGICSQWRPILAEIDRLLEAK